MIKSGKIGYMKHRLCSISFNQRNRGASNFQGIGIFRDFAGIGALIESK